MVVRQVNFDGCLSYIVSCENTAAAMIVDPSHELDTYLDYVRAKGLHVIYVLDTHTHVDHISLAPQLADRLGAKTLMHENYEAQRTIKSDILIPRDIVEIVDENRKNPVDRVLSDGESLSVGTITFRVMLTPGHTLDAICLLGQGRIFTGDTLLIGQCGRTDLPGGSYAAMYDSLFERLFPLSDEFIIYPAHDYKGNINSTLGYERVNNVCLNKKRTLEEFGTFLKGLFPPLNSEGGKLQCGLTTPAQPSPEGDQELNPLMRTFCFSMEQYLQQPHEETLISPDRLFERLKTGEDILILDVREHDELVSTGYIERAVNIPVAQVAGRIAELPADLDKPIVAVCESGARSGHAALYLRAYGYNDVKNLEYGMRGWRTEGYPLVYPT
jgi:glyoxylase-like metal-dependent hydrolase (beta-lactamase superfamily II)/rhodanese-related sulfurtransferase